jgi:hypothetical protein
MKRNSRRIGIAGRAAKGVAREITTKIIKNSVILIIESSIIIGRSTRTLSASPVRRLMIFPDGYSSKNEVRVLARLSIIRRNRGRDANGPSASKVTHKKRRERKPNNARMNKAPRETVKPIRSKDFGTVQSAAP